MKKTFLLSMLCASLTAVAAPLSISIDGKPNAEIVLPKALQTEQPALLAAQELQLWVREIGGAEILRGLADRFRGHEEAGRRGEEAHHDVLHRVRLVRLVPAPA